MVSESTPRREGRRRAEPIVLASYYTLAGAALPENQGGTELSPWDVAARIEAAGAAGYRGFGFSSRDLGYWMNIHGPARLRRWLDEAGIEVVELEMLDDWYTDGESRIAADARAQLVLGWAEELGARHVKVGTGYSCLEVPLVQLADGLTELCTRAADAGTRIALEPMPVGAVRTPAEGLALIEEVGAPNAGLCIDVWHVVRTGVDYESLREIPGERIATIELIDGFADPVEGNLLLDGTSYRRLAGTGEFEVDRFLSAILATGYDGPFGDENISIENRARSLTEAARVNFEATMGSVKNILERDDR